MAKKTFLPNKEGARMLWLSNFAGNLEKYAAKYSITDEEVKDMKACAVFYKFWVDYANQVGNFYSQVITYKELMRGGMPHTTASPVTPAPPDISSFPDPVAPGIFARASSIGLRIKKNRKYTSGDGVELALEGPEKVIPNLNEITPKIDVVTGNGGHPTIIWKKGRMHGLDIYADRGDGKWIFLGTDVNPNYTDIAPLPLPDHSAYWKYRCMYRYKDETVGQWSSEVGIAVTG